MSLLIAVSLNCELLSVVPLAYRLAAWTFISKGPNKIGPLQVLFHLLILVYLIQPK